MMPDLLGWLLTGRRRRRADRRLDDPVARPPHRALVRCALPGARPAPVDPPRPGRARDRARSAPAGPGRGGGPDGRSTSTVLAPATHDTASAVAAVPVVRPAGVAAVVGPPDWCYLSSGTWSLLGVEVPSRSSPPRRCRATSRTRGAWSGTTRLLKNIMGLWLVQECRRTWARQGRDYSYDELLRQRAGGPAVRRPGRSRRRDVPLARRHARPPGAPIARRTGQAPPRDEGGFVRCALESLALKYRWTIERLEAILGTTDPDDPRRRRRDPEHPALPVHRRRLRPPRPRRPGRGDRRGQRPPAGHGAGAGSAPWPTPAPSSPARSPSPSTSPATPPRGPTPRAGSTKSFADEDERERSGPLQRHVNGNVNVNVTASAHARRIRGRRSS